MYKKNREIKENEETNIVSRYIKKLKINSYYKILNLDLYVNFERNKFKISNSSNKIYNSLTSLSQYKCFIKYSLQCLVNLFSRLLAFNIIKKRLNLISIIIPNFEKNYMFLREIKSNWPSRCTRTTFSRYHPVVNQTHNEKIFILVRPNPFNAFKLDKKRNSS